MKTWDMMKAICQVRLARRPHVAMLSHDPAIAASLAAMLPRGWRLSRVHSANAALKLVESRCLALMLLDDEVPGARNLIRSLARFPHRTSCVLIAARKTDALWEEVLASGGFDVLTKPVDSHLFQRVLLAGWSHWKSQRALDRTEPRMESARRGS